MQTDPRIAALRSALSGEPRVDLLRHPIALRLEDGVLTIAGEVSDAVRPALEKDPLVDASELRVTTRAAIVPLDGTAPSLAQREAAELDAWCVHGVDRVVNRIAIRPFDAPAAR